MKIRLGEIVDVQIGYQHREKIGAASDGTYKLIQVKDVVKEGDRFSEFFEPSVGIWTGSLYRVTPKGDPDRYRVGPGDVLFLARGSRNFAIPIEPRSVRPGGVDWGNVVVGSYFFILRPRPDRLFPEYLAWAINQPPAQKQLDDMAHGSHMKLIPKKRFEELEIDLPPVEVQKKIVRLNALAERERHLTETIQVKRAELVRATTLRAAKQG